MQYIGRTTYLTLQDDVVDSPILLSSQDVKGVSGQTPGKATGVQPGVNCSNIH
jgi:hypothetical protein